MAAYYNENDPKIAAWLRELIKAGLVADGEVDTRSIVDVQPDDVRGFTQCHFFAGIGGWSYALRLAGWPDDREVWTGSCPCQPFSSAGAQAGGHDPRDLWPAWFKLIAECRPGVIFGEQVESAIGHGWLDRLHDDLEKEGYAVGPVGLPSACVGAFDIRQRLWFVAESQGEQHDGRGETRGGRRQPANGGVVGVAYAGSQRLRRERLLLQRRQPRSDCAEAAGSSASGELGDTNQQGSQRRLSGWQCADERAPWTPGLVDWIPCRDGKWRPVESGTFPLAYGIPARVGRLRGYGNAINAWVAKEVIGAYMDICQ